MRVRILAVGTRMPEWVTTAYEDYTRRMRFGLRVDLEVIPVGRTQVEEERSLLQRVGDDYLIRAIDGSDLGGRNLRLNEARPKTGRPGMR